MSKRNARRRIRRMEEKGLTALLATLPRRDRSPINEKIISAINELTDLDGRGPKGTKMFIEGRARQLIVDIEKVGFAKASSRFRVAIAKRKKADAERAEDAPKCYPPYPGYGGVTIESEKAFEINEAESRLGRGTPPTISPLIGHNSRGADL